MPSNCRRNLIKLDTNLAITLPKNWTTFFNMKKGEQLDIIYDSVLIVFPPRHPKLNELRKKMKKVILS